MTPPRPTVEPQSFIAGDTLQFDRDFPNFPASDGWALSYYLGGIGLTNIADISGANVTSTGGTFNINVPAATTAKWSPGKYSWRAVVVGSGSFSGKTFNVAQGQIEIFRNPASANAEIDTRTEAQINIDAIKYVLATRAGQDVTQYRVGHGITGREFQKESTADLRNHLLFWEARRKLERIQAGERFPSDTIGIYFGRPTF